MLVEYKGEYTAIREMRKHIAWYIKGFQNATEIRRDVNQIENLENLKELIGNIRCDLKAWNVDNSKKIM